MTQTSTPITPADLLRVIEASELMNRRELAEYWSQLEANGMIPADAIEFAQIMVCEGILTQFQATLLLQGRYKNFFLGGKYKVLEQLGAGGMGTVYLCEHRYMRRRVAIKLLPPEKSQTPAIVQRFLREAEAIARMDHPNIVRAFDISRQSGVFFLVMEYVEGVNFQQLVSEHGALSMHRAVNYTVQSALGLHHAHVSGLVHRDVKPANLLLDRNGIVKVLDLGLARFSDGPQEKASKSSGDNPVVLGTADYIAPEQAVNASMVDHRADVYSLGCTLYFLLTGRPPYEGSTLGQKLMKHQAAPIPNVNALRPDVPKGVAEVLMRSMAKKPEDRVQTTHELALALRPWYVTVPPPSVDEMPAARYASHGDLESTSMGSMSGSMSGSMGGSMSGSSHSMHNTMVNMPVNNKTVVAKK